MSLSFQQPSIKHVDRPRIGVVGTGFIALGLCDALKANHDMTLSRVLTRRDVKSLAASTGLEVTNSIDEFLSELDIVVECSGDIFHACEVISAAQQRGLPVVTMATEFHVTVGSYFAQRGYLTEAEGDQPGSLAALVEEALDMGFKPLVYGNMKGYLNHHPTLEDMQYWSGRNGISLAQVTSFTDGTKMQFEQAFVANGLNAGLYQQGMLGPKDVALQEGGDFLGAKAKEYGAPISDYILNGKLPAGVFVVAEHPSAKPEVLRYLKMGEGPYYTLLRPYHLCHLEISKTIRRVMRGAAPLLNNSVKPNTHVVAIAKHDMAAGFTIEQSIGAFNLRGEAAMIEQTEQAVPIGLLKGARIKHGVEAGQLLTIADVDLPNSMAVDIWQSLLTERSVILGSL